MRTIQTPDRDWRLGLCAGAGAGLGALVVPKLLGLGHLGMLVIGPLTVLGFLIGFAAYSFFFIRRF